LGTEGIAYSSLRPSGKVLIHDTLYDAQADIAYVEKDTQVVITRHEAGKIVVRPIGTKT